MESATSANTILPNSKRPQRITATKAPQAEVIQIEPSSSEDTLKKKSPAAFQLIKKVIPDDAGHIKVSSTPSVGL